MCGVLSNMVPFVPSPRGAQDMTVFLSVEEAGIALTCRVARDNWHLLIRSFGKRTR